VVGISQGCAADLLSQITCEQGDAMPVIASIVGGRAVANRP
jgi:hypothetical protein